MRRSLSLPTANPDLAELLAVLDEYGPMCEAMFLMMAADRHMRNAERAVLRGALDVLSNGRVRTYHMEAMLDASARRLADEGEAARRAHVIRALKQEPAMAEPTLVLAAAVALADDQVVAEESAWYRQLAEGLGVGQDRAEAILTSLTQPPEG